MSNDKPTREELEKMSERSIKYHRRMDVIDYDLNGHLTVQCYTCKKFSYVLDRMYRCFDCGVWLCGNCVPDHFSNRHEPHPLHLHEYETRLAALDSTPPESPAPCPVCADSLSLLEMLGGYFEQCIEDRRGVPNAELILSQIKNAIAKAAEGCGK